MVDFLIECNMRANRPAVVTTIMRSSRAQYEHDIKVMADTADESKVVVLWGSILLT